MIFLFVCRIAKNLALFLEFSNSRTFSPLIASADYCYFLFLSICLSLCFSIYHTGSIRGRTSNRITYPYTRPPLPGIHKLIQAAPSNGAGMRWCARVCAGVRGCARVIAGLCGSLQVYVCDEFSEYLLETRVLTSADFNTYPIRILSIFQKQSVGQIDMTCACFRIHFHNLKSIRP